MYTHTHIIPAEHLPQGFLGVTIASDPQSPAYAALKSSWTGRVEDLENAYTLASFDAVHALAHALHALLQAGHELRALGDPTLLKQALLGVEFRGATGRIRFDANFDPLEAGYMLVAKLLPGHGLTPVARYVCM